MFYLLKFLSMHAHVREIKEWVEVVRGLRGKKWGVYCFMLPGLCHVGCARMAGQKYLIKLYFLVLERRGTGFCLDLLSVCVASFIFSCSFPAPASNNLAPIQWLLVFYGQVIRVELLNMAMDKATFLLLHSSEVHNQFYIISIHILITFPL